MQQYVLDPADPPVERDWKPPGPTPPAFREFRRFPDVEKWLPGDLILVNEVKPGQIAKTTIGVQKQGFDEEHARWHHAAIYVGDGLSICEATREGVQAALLYKYCGSHRLRIRRASKLDLNTRWKINPRTPSEGRAIR